ncbi:MAG: histidine phosphatase family protein [Halofilum sp. (in: g-proteobacteria)]|nr:histidine phosphatase family protein [Halofilum sp. (in: g-proteobacteria)]
MNRDPRPTRRGRFAALTLLLALACTAPTASASATPQALARALLDGGHVIYFRHAATEWSQHDQVSGAGDWTSCDPEEMRQLSAAGRDSARAVGRAMRQLGIPVADVHSSPYCRCVETAELLGLGPVETTLDLLNARAAEYVGGRDALRESARRRLGTRPPAGANTVLVAHGNVFLLAAGERPPEGGAAIVRPLGDGEFELLGTIPAGTWPELVER